MGAEQLHDLGQFAVQPPTGHQQRPPAPRTHRFLASVIDSFVYTALNTLCTVVIAKAFHGDKVTPLVAFLVFHAVYYILPLYVSGQTLGKKIMKIQVVPVAGGEDIGMGQAFMREWPGKAISILALGLGYITILFDKENRGWHDKIAKTRVVTLKD
jgi:uncharacterized RDD family membrane protein YckC